MNPKILSRLGATVALAAMLGASPARADLTVVQVAPLSGPLADTGLLLQQGANLAFQDANARAASSARKSA